MDRRPKPAPSRESGHQRVTGQPRDKRSAHLRIGNVRSSFARVVVAGFAWDLVTHGGLAPTTRLKAATPLLGVAGGLVMAGPEPALPIPLPHRPGSSGRWRMR